MSFREVILSRLEERDRSERIPQVEIFKAYDELVHYCVALQSSSDRSRRDTGEASGPAGDKLRECERKLADLQEEITDLLRRKGENAQAVINLNRTVQERDAEIIILKQKLKKAETTIDAQANQIRKLESDVSDTDKTNQLLKDEYFALQTTYNLREESCRRLEEETGRLRDQCLHLNERLMENENQANELMSLQRQIQMTKILNEAAKDPLPAVHMDQSHSDHELHIPPPVCFGAVIPNRYKLKLEAHDSEVNAVQWSPSGRKFATGGGDRKVKIWEIRDDRPQCTAILSESNQGINCVQFDSDETSVLGCSNDHVTRIWTISDRRLRHALHGHGNKVMSAKYFDMNQRVVSGSHDRTLKIWDLRLRTCTKTLFAGSYCNDLVSSDGPGASIISGHYDKRLRFWDLHADTPISDILMPGRITSLDLSIDRNYLLCCHREDSLEYIDLRTNRTVHTLNDDGFKVGLDSARAVFSPDGQYCLVGGHDGRLFFWNLKTGKLEKSLKGHDTCVSACSWSPDGQTVLSCDKHKTVMLWSEY